MRRPSQVRSFSMRKRREKNSSKNVWLLGGSSFFIDVGAEMIVPLLPFYILSLGGGGISLGLVSGLREGLSSIFKIFGGYLSDKTGKRKPYIFFGYLISSIFKFLIGMATSWQSLVAFVSLERFGKFRDAPRDALISSDGKKHNGRDFGITQTLDVLGGIIGTILVLILFWKFNIGIRSIIYIAAAISLFSILPIFFVKERKIRPVKKGLFREMEDFEEKLKYFIFVSSFFSFANFGLSLFLLLIVKEFTGSIAMSFLFYIIFNLAYAIFLVPFGNLSDKIGSKKILFFGYLLFFVTMVGLFFFENIWHLGIIFVLYGLVSAMTYSSHRKIVSNLSDDMKGTAFGAFYTAIGISAILGGIIAGALWNVGHDLMFGYLAVLGLISVMLVCFVREK